MFYFLHEETKKFYKLGQALKKRLSILRIEPLEAFEDSDSDLKDSLSKASDE